MPHATLTPLGLSALALLSESPMHPYEMYQLLVRRHKTEIVKVRPGSLYHAVDRLGRDGYARAVSIGRDGLRPEKTTYEITESGRHALDARVSQMLATYENEFPEFDLAISEAHNLPRTTVIELLNERLESLRLRRSEVGDMIRQNQSSESAKRLFFLDAEHRHALLDTEIAWVEALVDDLVANRIEWLDDPGFAYRPHPDRTPSLRTPSLTSRLG